MNLKRLRSAALVVAALGLALSGTGSATAAPPASPADTVNPKADSPETDLENYPKRTELPDPAGAGPSAEDLGTVHDGELVVMAAEDLGDGNVRHTIWDAAPGVSPRALAGKLRAQGERNVVVATSEQATMGRRSTSGEFSSMAANSCSYGSATSLRCAPLHWSNNGFSDPQVYFNDRSGANWPTDAAVYTWNQSVGIDSYYRYNSCGPAGTHCVNVYSGNYGDSGWTGRTHFEWNTSTLNFNDGTVYSHLNDYYKHTADGYRKTTCHELGHALGMGHNSDDYGCMWGTSRESGHRVPDSDDFNMLASIYSIVR